MRKILLVGLSVILIAAACNKSTTSNTESNTTSDQTTSNQNTTAVLSGTAEVTITAAGFSPANITVRKGTVVTFKNTDSQPHWPASDPHPTHTDLPGFDAKLNMVTGADYSFTFTQLGTWGYHDHDNPTRKGSVTVVE